MPMLRRNKSNSQLGTWARLVSDHANAAINLTVGLMSGSRLDIDRRAVDRLAIAATAELRLSTLLVRLSVQATKAAQPHVRVSTELPDAVAVKESPLGRWREVALELPLGGSAPRVLETLPKWLAGWKKEYRLILIDLGPMYQVPCRTVGRYCDACYLVLGPESCASHTWIMHQIALLSRCDVPLVGTLVAQAQEAVAA